jgi:uncharacterized membrane protein YcaP (DUF421 family)
MEAKAAQILAEKVEQHKQSVARAKIEVDGQVGVKKKRENTPSATHKHTDRHTDRQTHRHRHTGTDTHRHTQTHRHTDTDTQTQTQVTANRSCDHAWRWEGRKSVSSEETRPPNPFS